MLDYRQEIKAGSFATLITALMVVMAKGKVEAYMVTISRLLILAVLLLSIPLLAACDRAPGEVVQSTQTEPATRVETPASSENAPVEDAAAPAETTASAEEETAELPEATVAEPQTAATGDPAETAAAPPEPFPPDPVEVTFFTPEQQEGPYYTVDKPADRDNDLVTFAGATAIPAGQVVEFGGIVYDAGGYPIEGAVVEIWQTDASGVYHHPGDPGTGNRDRNFQFYGEAQTDANGSYMFRTILPGLYEPRPRHIHVKVRLDGQEVLTTQFYFAGEIDLQGAEAMMLIDAQPGVDDDGNAILVGRRDIFLNVGAVGG